MKNPTVEIIAIPRDANRRIEVTRCPDCGQPGYESTAYFADARWRTLLATHARCTRCGHERSRDGNGQRCTIVLT